MSSAKPQNSSTSVSPSPGVTLPVIESASKIRPSKSSRWRAGVLILVHVLIAAHIAHWWLTGSTLSPLEPSEGMEFAKRGVINTGFVLFAVAIVGTMISGRWFCGWGCHIVALQDLSRWILAKMRIKPKPFRGGGLAVVPLVAFVYMFLAPSLSYALRDEIKWSMGEAHFVTTTFWATFPGWLGGILAILICGFLIVYLLGAKGYCTYACPYGGVFGLVDQLSPWRIRVTDACKGCGHCTSVCTSNVRVHQEVRDFGMVVDPGCMKCLDCVSVCPNDALYFGLGVPAILAKSKSTPKRGSSSNKATSPSAVAMIADMIAQWALTVIFVLATISLFMWYDGDLDWRASLILTAAISAVAVLFKGKSTRNSEFLPAEQALIYAAFLLSSLAFRGLLGGVPFLVSLGIAAIFAYLSVQCARLLYKPNLTIRGRRLKSSGRLLPWGYALATLGLAGWSCATYSSFVQYHIKTCDLNFARSGDVRSTWFAPGRAELTAQQQSRIKRAFDSAQFVDRWGVFEDHRSEYQLAWLHLLTGDERSFETKTRQLLEELPKDVQLHGDYAGFLFSKRRLDEARLHHEIAVELQLEAAAQRFEAAVVKSALLVSAHFDYGSTLARLGRVTDGIEHLRKAVELDASSFEARVNLANLLFRSGQYDQAVSEYEHAIELNPEHTELRLTVAQAYAAVGQYSQAEAHLEQAVELAPSYIPAHRMLIDLAQFQGDIERAKKLSQRMLKLNPEAAPPPN